MSIEVLRVGAGLALQDGGRRGWLHYGVPRGGAMDLTAMRGANRLLGNRPDAPVLEVTMLGARLKILETTWVALGGANHCEGLPAWTARRFEPGAVLDFACSDVGLFSYLAVPGGFSADRWFGSVAVDPRNGIGRPLGQGDCLAPVMRSGSDIAPGVKRRMLVPEERQSYARELSLVLLPGPQFGLFSESAREQLIRGLWMVSPKSDRTGFRLDGETLAVPEQMPSEPVLPGSFQVPGNGRPIVTMVDGPTVGGYPKIAVLRESDRDRLAQCAPGTKLQFSWEPS